MSQSIVRAVFRSTCCSLSVVVHFPVWESFLKMYLNGMVNGGSCLYLHVCALSVCCLCSMQEEFTAMREQYMRGGEGFIVVYSVVDRNSFEKIRKFKDMIEKVRNMDVKDIPLVLAGNKRDLTDKRRVSKADGETLAEELGCPLFETSAALRENVDEVFHSVVRVIRTKEREEYHRQQGTLRSSRKGGGFCSCFSSSAID